MLPNYLHIHGNHHTKKKTLRMQDSQGPLQKQHDWILESLEAANPD